MTVRAPHRDELERLRAIELAAGRAFAAVGMPEIAADQPPGVDELEEFLAAGRAWVAADDDGEPVAYLLAAVVDDGLHVEQVSVRPDHAGRRIGAALIEHLAGVARAEGRSALTLTTFRDVPWNAPY
jgi:GNAT superfamily N-acetyltransferase